MVDQNITLQTNPPTPQTDDVSMPQVVISDDQQQTQGNTTLQPEAPTPVGLENQPIVQVTDTSSDVTLSSGTQEDYIDNVGGSFTELLEDVLNKTELMTQIANEMKISDMKCNSIAVSLQNKISQNQLTKEEIAFILTATIVDLPPEENPS